MPLAETAPPKAFISYSWTSEAHRQMVRECADRLLSDGVNVILDQYDLKEGHDKYAFMEKVVTDQSVTHVLLFCDKLYAEKADARKAGVGTESQIISQEIYNKVAQSKFIPIVCELSPRGDPYLPTFLKSRIWLDFSSPEARNEHWEQLVRLLHGKPAFQKPPVGTPPSYITADAIPPATPAASKFATFKQAYLQGKRGAGTYRGDFLDACFEYADSSRVRQAPDLDALPSRVLSDCDSLVPVRDLIADWVLLEAGSPSELQFEDGLAAWLERLLELRARPKELTSYNDAWFEAHELFAYETFLYIGAALLKASAFSTLHAIFHQRYLAPDTEVSHPDQRFTSFSAFYAYSRLLNHVLAPAGQRLLSPAATLLKRHATRKDLPFELIMETDLLALLCAAAQNTRWFPQTLFYAGYGRVFPFFLRAAEHKHFQKLSVVTGIAKADEFRAKVRQGFENMRIERWTDFQLHGNLTFWEAANMDKLDSIK